MMLFRKSNVQLNQIILASVMVLALLSGWHSSATQAQADEFLTALPEIRAAYTVDPTDPLAIQQRLVSFNPTQLQTRSSSPLTLSLFDGKQIEIEVERFDHTASGGQLFIGHAAGYPLSDIIFTWQDNIGAGTINLGHEIYRLRHVENGVHVFEQLPPQYLQAGDPITPNDLELEPHSTAHIAAVPHIEIGDVTQPDQAVSIDVLVLYTQSAEQVMGGVEGTQNTIDLAITESNTGFQQSGINIKFDLVHSQKVDYSESQNNFSKILGELKNSNDGVLDDIHALRDQYGADVVTLIVNRPLLCGKTYQNNGTSADFSSHAFSVLHHSCATGYYSFAHEIGHNMGSQHNRSSSSQPGAFNYSHGYQDPANRFRTIMAYNCPLTCLRVNHWSNPNVQYQNLGPTGQHAHSADGADNHLSLTQMAPSVAKFRDRQLAPNQPAEIGFQAMGEAAENQLVDSGEPFQAHANGLVYGWNADYSLSPINRDLKRSASNFVHAIAAEGDKATWEMLVPNGRYQVRVTSGDSVGNLQIFGLHIENELVMPNSGSGSTSFLEADIAVDVTDGRLTISGTSHETILNQVEITPLFLDNQSVLIGAPTLPYTIYLPIVVR